MTALRLFFCCVLLGLATAGLSHAAEKLPARPAQYFNDYAKLVPPQRARAFEERLRAFERETSNQFLVVVYPQLPPRADVFDFTVRAAQSWQVGRKDRDNGVVLFVFVRDRALQIQTGYGLEGALPDAVAHTIIENEIKPRFRSGDFTGGLDAGINAVIAATRGEYKGTGRIRGEGQTAETQINPAVAFIFFVVIIAMSMLRRARNAVFGRPRHHRPLGGGHWGGFGGGGGGWSGGGGFSGGGGSFGGGGAGGRW